MLALFYFYKQKKRRVMWKSIVVILMSVINILSTTIIWAQPDLEVSGIMSGKDKRAVINGNIAKHGDVIEGAEVVEINENSVKFRYEDKVFTRRVEESRKQVHVITDEKLRQKTITSRLESSAHKQSKGSKSHPRGNYAYSYYKAVKDADPQAVAFKTEFCRKAIEEANLSLETEGDGLSDEQVSVLRSIIRYCNDYLERHSDR